MAVAGRRLPGRGGAVYHLDRTLQDARDSGDLSLGGFLPYRPGGARGPHGAGLVSGLRGAAVESQQHGALRRLRLGRTVSVRSRHPGYRRGTFSRGRRAPHEQLCPSPAGSCLFCGSGDVFPGVCVAGDKGTALFPPGGQGHQRRGRASIRAVHRTDYRGYRHPRPGLVLPGNSARRSPANTITNSCSGAAVMYFNSPTPN